MKRLGTAGFLGGIIVTLNACGGTLMPHAGIAHTVPALTPYTLAADLSGYGVGAWARYRQDSDGYSSETTIRCVGQMGENLWIEVALPEHTHLLLVQRDRAVLKAYFSGPSDRNWRTTEVRDMKGAAAGECPACLTVHKAGVVTWTDDRRTVDGRELACRKAETAGFDCDGNEMKVTSWYSKDVPRLMSIAAGLPAEGGFVASEHVAGSVTLVAFGLDAQPKHDLPRE